MQDNLYNNYDREKKVLDRRAHDNFVEYHVTDRKEDLQCDRCRMSFSSESQVNAHKVSVHAVASGELTTR